jgi:hypothetical protein
MITNKNLKTNDRRLAFCIGLWTLSCSISLTAQGLILDPAAYDTTPQLPLYNGAKGVLNLPPQYSLRNYCPTPDDQGGLNSCVAFACSYGAFTLVQAKKQGWSSATIAQNAYSAAYIFNQIGTKEGMSFKDAFNFMANEGVCRAVTFPNSNIVKGIKPPQSAQNEAKSYKIIPPPTPKIGKTAQEIKDKLAQGQPVIFGASIESDFRKRYNNQEIWQPQTVGEAHAMLIIGYDDKTQTFDIMNSYGTGWGRGGFIKLKYTDLDKVFKTAYVLAPSGAKGMGETTGIIDSTQREEIGSFQLKNYIGKTTKADGQSIFEFEKTAIRYNTERQLYETNRRDWRVNDVFQLLSSGIPTGKYLYVFSLDAVNKLTVHWPPDARWAETDARTSAYYAPNFGQTPVSPLILSPKTVLTIPAPDEGLQIKNSGEDQLVVLISDKVMPNFKQRLEQFKTATGDAPTRLTTVFKDVLIPINRIIYMKDAITIRRFIYESKGSVVPMILAVKVD